MADAGFSDDEDFDVRLDNETTSRKRHLRPEKHLDSPITTSLLTRLQEITKAALVESKNVRECQYDPHRGNTVNKYLQRHPEIAYSSIRSLVTQYASALDFCKEPPEILTAQKYPLLFSYSNEAPYRLQSDFLLAKKIFSHEIQAYASELSDVLSPTEIQSFIGTMTPFNAIGEDVVLSSCRAQLWSDIVEEYRRSYKSHRTTKKRHFGPIRTVIADGFLLIKTDELKRWQLMTFEQLQMIQDCCLARHNVELALRFGFHNGTSELQKYVHQIFQWQENVLRTIGNDGYDLVKAPEAVFKAWLNSLTDGDLLTYSSYERTLDKMREKETKLCDDAGGTFPISFVDSLDQIVKSVTDIHDAAELFGLAKLSGHPTVYAHKSAKSVRKEAEPTGTVLPFAVRQEIRMFRHLTLSGYIKRHASWPKFKCPPAHDTELRRHYVNQVTSLPMGSYPISDLDTIQFDKFVEYDYSEDYLKFLDDKAICPGASELSKFWFGGQGVEPRRLLQKILQMTEFDTFALVERLRKGHFTPDERVVELTQKERELKPAARCFCKLPFAVRTFFTSTEYNLKEQFMSKYMPQQTMTMSNTETKQRMYNLVKTAKSKDRTLLEVDFSRWNLRWRGVTVNPIAYELEDIFGLKGVFSQAHEFFSRATIVLTDKHTLPDFADAGVPITQWRTSSLVWRGTHLGGFEGIQQALWTICTIAMMYWVLHDQNLSFNMAGQGDNQIFAITFDSTDVPLAAQLRKLLAVMEIRCSLLNHEVKPDECIDSRTVLTYSKDIYVEGNHILYNLKFASRTFRRQEIDVPSLSTEIAGISACSMACADSVYNTPKAIFWKTFHTIRLFSDRFKSPNHSHEHPHLAKILNNDKLCRFVILLPGSLGGIPAMSWTRFFMKGEVDDLSWDVPACRALGCTIRELHWDLKRTLDGLHSPKSRNLHQLILDPHSIPLDRPKDMKRLIKEAVAEKILDHTNNRWIREIFTGSSDETDERLMDALLTTRPLYPQIMSDIYSLSPSGVRDALLSRFTMTRTINNITGNPDFTEQIAAAGARLLQYLIKRFESASGLKGIPVLPSSSFETCVQLRHLWGDFVEHKNIGVYNPFDFKIAYPSSKNPCISASSRCDEEYLHTSLGPYPPNFGTRTKQKISDHGFKILSSSSTVVDLKKIIVTYSELGGSQELSKILSTITHARSPWTIHQLATILPTSIGGTAAHRHAAINSAAFSLLGSRTVPTHLNFSSDKAGVLSGGEFDYPIAFQEFYLTLTNLFQVLSYHKLISTNASLSFTLTDKYEALTTETVTGTVPKNFSWRLSPTNKLCYVSKLQVGEIPITPHPSQIPHVRAEDLKPADLLYNRLLVKYCGKRKLLSSTSTVNLPIDVLDIKEFNHCPHDEVLRGITYFVQSMAVYTAVTEFAKDAHTFLHECILNLSRACAALFARILLHPLFAADMYNVEMDIVATPGQSGARSAADQLAGDIYATTLLSMKSREMLTREVPLILFADYASHASITSEIYSTIQVALQSHDQSRILLTSYQRLMLKSARHSIIDEQRTLNTVLNFKSTLDAFARVRHQRAKKRDTEPILINHRFCFTNSIPEEAIRALRDRPVATRVTQAPISPPPMVFGPDKNVWRFERTNDDGSLKPQHTCAQRSSAERSLESSLALLRRPYGLHSSALSVWLTIARKNRQYLHQKNIVCIGVGHGATAATTLLYGAQSVVGIDLRSSFPIISQREATYKPPEVISTGRADRFEWSKFISITGGDVLGCANQLTEVEESNTWIVDIEQPHSLCQEFLENIPTNVSLWIRLICCEEWARFYVDALNVTHVYNTSEIRSCHESSYIFIVDKFTGYNRNGNYNRIQFVSMPSYTNSVMPSPKYSVRMFNSILRPFGEHIKVLSAHELKDKASILLQRSYNSNTPSSSLSLSTTSVMLSTIADIYLTLEDDNISRFNELSTLGRRLLSRWLANTSLDLNAFRQKLHSCPMDM